MEHQQGRRPFVIPPGPVNYWDVDDTLARWRLVKEETSVKIVCRGREVYINPIKENVEELIVQSLKGSHNVVWSTAGVEWVEAVVKGLKLEQYVDVMLSKPIRLYDDIDPSIWLPKRRHMEADDDGTHRS